MQYRYTVPLVEKTRGELVETVYRGVITIVSSDGEIRYSVGNPNFKPSLRYSAKPFQLLPFVESAQNYSRIRNRTETCYKVVRYEEYVPGNEWSSGFVRHKTEKHSIHCPY